MSGRTQVQKKSKQGGKTVGKSTPGGKRKRGARGDSLPDFNDEQDAFHESDKEGASGDDSEEELQETAEEKRLRLAKAYLQRVRAMEEADRSGSDDEEGGDRHAELSERLRNDAMEAMGHLQRKIAHRVVMSELPAGEEGSNAGRFFKCHRLPVTALALSNDDRKAFSVSKDGSIVELDIETGVRTKILAPPGILGTPAPAGAADWVSKAAARAGGSRALLSVAISTDGHYLAVGGGDRKVHVWDARSRQYVQGFPGHKDAVSALTFRDGTHELFSGSFDRTIKIWSLDDRAYVDSLFGHQADVVALDAGRAERLLSCGQDHTCRVWKIPEESQLIFRSHGQAVDCAAYLTGTEWVTGSSDGSVAVWSQLKKKPVAVVRGAHYAGVSATAGFPFTNPDGDAAVESAAGDTGNSAPEEASSREMGAEVPLGPGSVGGDCASWVSAVAVCKGTDLVASGAGDGVIRLWGLEGEAAGKRSLRELGGLPARGFVNALAIARSGRFLLAGMGKEPRTGRWSADQKARNGLLLHQLNLSDD